MVLAKLVARFRRRRYGVRINDCRAVVVRNNTVVDTHDAGYAVTWPGSVK